MEKKKNIGCYNSKVLEEYKSISRFEPCLKQNIKDGESCQHERLDLKRDPIGHEQHHAMHALTFFYFLVFRTLNGERVRRRLLARIIHHLMDLREFLEEGPLNELTNDLCSTVQLEYDGSLCSLIRGIHKGIRVVVSTFERGERKPFLSTVSTILIGCSEGDVRSKICMYPWLVANQGKILRLARYYSRESLFNKLIPVIKPTILKD